MNDKGVCRTALATPGLLINYVLVMKNFLNPKGHQNRFSGSKVTAILLKGCILPIGGVASGRVCACSLRGHLWPDSWEPQEDEASY